MTVCGVVHIKFVLRAWVKMIGKDYFKRQATTLRKMVVVAQDKTVADRLTDLADGFEAKAGTGSDPGDDGARPAPTGEAGGRK